MVTTNAPALLYTGNGVTTVFNAPWAQFSTELNVTTYLNGQQTNKTLTTDYTISGSAPTSFQITFLIAPANGVEVVVFRTSPQVNAADFTQARINPSDLNSKFDLLTENVQELFNLANRAIKVPITESSVASFTEAAFRKGMVIGFNSSTGALELKAIPSVILGMSDIVTALGYTPANVASITDERAMIDLLGNTRGSIIYRGSTGWTTRVPGTSGFPLVSSGAGADPNYQAISASGSINTPALPIGMIASVYNRLLYTWLSTSTFSIGIGAVSDSTFTDIMALLISTTKNQSAWVVGSGNGGKMSAAAIANNTWYYIYVIKRPDTGVVDIGFDVSPSSPTLPTNYTLFRMVAAVQTNGSAQFIQEIMYADGTQAKISLTDDVNDSTLTTSRKTYTIASVPAIPHITSFNWITAHATGSNPDFYGDTNMTDTATQVTGPVVAKGGGLAGNAVACFSSNFYMTGQSLFARANASSTTLRISIVSYNIRPFN